MPDFQIPPVNSVPVDIPYGQRRRVVIVSIPRARPLDFIGPMDVLRDANFMLQYSGRPDLGYDIEIVSTTPGLMYEENGVTISVDKPYHRLRGKVDTLILQAIDYQEACMNDRRFIGWVKRMAPRVRRLTSICIGAYILAESGLLDGRRATTHWCSCEDFARRYPKVKLEPDPIFVKDGNIYTSAGASAGLDMMLGLIEEDFGKELALRVAQGLVMYLKRPGNQSQFSVHVSGQLPAEAKLADVQSYIAENLQRNLNVETLADTAGMSPRNFSRVFARDVGMTPGKYIELSRLEKARQLLESSGSPIAQVASRCGYKTTETMRAAFDRHLGVSPRDYRRRFATAESSS